MLKVFLLLTTLVWPAFKDASAYTLLSQLANVPFYFMPVFVAYGVAKKLGSTPLYAMSVAAALVYPDFIAMLKEGPVTIFMLPVTKVSYSSTLLPALLIGIFACYCEKFLTKIIPGILRTVLVGAGTMTITYIAGVTVLGPLGDLVGGVVVKFFLWASATFGPVAIALLASAMGAAHCPACSHAPHGRCGAYERGMAMVSVYPLWEADDHTGQPRRGQDILCHASCGGLHQSKAFTRYGDT